MYNEIPLGGRARDINSRKSRETVVNCYMETDQQGEFKRLRRAAGLRQFLTVGTGPIRGLKFIRGNLFVVSGNAFYVVDPFLNVTFIGNVDNNENIVDIETNGADAGQLIIVSNGVGWVLDADGSTFGQITDPDFAPDKTVAFLVQRMWLNRPGSNVFFASEVGKADEYNSLDFASADDNSDDLVVVESIKSNLILMGSRSIEVWQTVAASFPVRRITGATLDRGVLSAESVVRYEDTLFFLADDLTVRRYIGGQAPIISDLALNLAIRGDGTAANPGYTAPEKAEGTFIDDVEHKFYVITFPDDAQTWVFDVTTGVWHRRQSTDLGRWRGRLAELAFDRRIIGDFSNGNLYELTENLHTENGERQDMIVQTPPLSSKKAAFFISSIEAVMEVGDGSISNAIPELGITKQLPIKPLMRVEYSKDGGRTFNERKPVSLGAVGDKQHRVMLRQFGYTKRHFEFVLRLTIGEDIPINMYGLHSDIAEGLTG